MTVPVVFVNIGWMKRYEGHSNDDPLRAKNFSYFKKNNVSESKGHEQWNFTPKNGVVLGYVPRSANININRLGANNNQSEIHGVLVVFIARDPIANELKVVGWYRNATVARSAIFRRRHGSIIVSAPIKSSDWNVLPVGPNKGSGSFFDKHDVAIKGAESFFVDMTASTGPVGT